MRIEKLTEIIEKKSPLCIQDPWDNSGFQIKFEAAPVNRVLTAMEITNQVIDEAVNLRAEAIVTHHPMFFKPVKEIYDNTVTGNYIVRLVQNRINVYASHTPFDKCDGGNNDYLARLLHLCDIRVAGEDGFCRIGTVDGECRVSEYIEQICRWLNIDRSSVSFAGDLNSEVKTIGLCSGAGAEFASSLRRLGCDLFITGDVKYHDAQEAKESGLNILDIGHYGSEKIFTENMADYLRNNTDLDIIESEVDLDPFILL